MLVKLVMGGRCGGSIGSEEDYRACYGGNGGEEGGMCGSNGGGEK